MVAFIKTFLFPVLLCGLFITLRGSTTYPIENGTGIVKYPPVSTFESKCARCHGPQGAFYGKSFGQLPDKDLERFIRLMMKGPGGLNPSQTDIEAMMAYNKSLSRHRPFIFLASSDTTANGIIYSGESLPGTTLTQTGDGGSHQITTGDDGKWESGPVTLSGHIVFIVHEKADTVKLVPGKEFWTN